MECKQPHTVDTFEKNIHFLRLTKTYKIYIEVEKNLEGNAKDLDKIILLTLIKRKEETEMDR